MTTTWREVLASNGYMYYIPLDRLDVADEIHVNTHDPQSIGYGGSTLKFKLIDGSVKEVKGPWHTNASAMYKETGMLVTELTMTKITLWNIEDELIYEEKDYVLGHFYRGNRIAQQLAVVRDQTIKFKSESKGGSYSGYAYPDKRYEHRLSHRLSHREEDRVV